jgi:adenylate cyclase
MSKTQISRRLAAIMIADVAGYSRLMGADEAGTLAALREVREAVFSPQVAKHHGRIVKFMGDGAVVEFPSVVEAVNCATSIQQQLQQLNAGQSTGVRIDLRIGVNLGDVIVEDTDVFGDGVNVAARLQELAEPGGVALSGTAYEHAGSKVSDVFVDTGERALKNIAKPIRVFSWRPASAAGGDAKPLSPPAQPLPDKPSIVVLPFANMSGDLEQEHFADGVVEAITAALSRIRSFFVIARTSAFAYKGRAVNVQTIGRELGVAYVLEGSVQRAGGRVRITVQLVETANGAHLWAEKYDGAVDDIFDLQDHITERVAGAMQPSIRLAEVERARSKRPQDLGAYDYTMRAIRHVWMLERNEAAAALELLDKALEIDPDYSLALALSATIGLQLGGRHRRSARARARTRGAGDKSFRRRAARPGCAWGSLYVRAQFRRRTRAVGARRDA